MAKVLWLFVESRVAHLSGEFCSLTGDFRYSCLRASRYRLCHNHNETKYLADAANSEKQCGILQPSCVDCVYASCVDCARVLCCIGVVLL